MNLRRANTQEDPDVTLTPLIDVVFLLLIFFMISTTFERNSELAIELPEATAESEPSKESTIEVSIDAEGRYYINGRMLINTEQATIKRALKEASGPKFPPLILTADEGTPYQSIVTLMDVARQLGFARLRFATQLMEDPE
uniref:Biopolymer transport protein ExbD n=1 Tax=Candidatus Kentrum eta TaxID=2126337 RepID=A0A450V108_9GAMM|nr:MAG: biopolymer transport protein ExbD [Candidatus Kentron sp. H]VFJ98514.1 MAG: biopolymer transport protein ExbD [Candidatus Kentron sp. H]VFK03549.1 MAG: biopolymer transport protein ExbD [Candidatus Kentron sp. H]